MIVQTLPDLHDKITALMAGGRVPERSLKMMDAKRQSGACRVCTL